MTNLYFNLENKDNSDINYIINPFPDGQRSITIDELEIKKLYNSIHVIIIKSITDFKDIELIMSAVSAISKHTYNYSLYSPYIVGARSDRKFEPGGDMYFDDVILQLLDSCNFDEIMTIDNHCDRELLTQIPLWGMSEFYNSKNKFGIVFPDKSAYERFSNIDEVEVFTYMNKVRNGGKIYQEINNPDDLIDLLDQDEIIIFDDLFDGGASFVGLCEKFRNEYYFRGKLTIFVTHFVASKDDNLKKLNDLNVNIVTSNSYKWQNEYLKHTVIDVFDRKFLDAVI